MKLEKKNDSYIIETESLLENQKFEILIKLMDCDLQTLQEIERLYIKRLDKTGEKLYLTIENGEYVFKAINKLEEIKKI